MSSSLPRLWHVRWGGKSLGKTSQETMIGSVVQFGWFKLVGSILVGSSWLVQFWLVQVGWFNFGWLV